MISWIKNKFSFSNEDEYYEKKKSVFLGSCFFLSIGGYTVAKEIKDFAFVSIVGLDYLPRIKIVSMFVLIPLVFLYSRLVDKMRRYNLLRFYALVFGIGALIFTYFMAHPTIGLQNTDSSPYRVFGWFFYFFMEAYTPFVICVVWAFMNSVTKPEQVKKSYITMTAASKVGGALMAGFAWWWLYQSDCGVSCFSDTTIFVWLLFITSLSLFTIPVIITWMMRAVPGRFLHGYEAVYKLEKKRAKEEKPEEKGGVSGFLRSIFGGLFHLVREPYLFGIFGMIFCWEVVNVIFNYMRLGIGQAGTKSSAAFGVFLYKQACLTHVVGLFFVIFGTKIIVSRFGVRKSLIAIPVLIGASISYYLWVQTLAAATLAYIVMRAVNYALAYPLRESLYIPTPKEMKFKTKSWIDGFGAKISKTTGSSYNWMVVQNVTKATLQSINLVFFGGIILVWTLVASFLGKRFENAVKNNEVIGEEKKQT